MLDRIRHLEIVRQIATKHEDGHEERGVEREDEALEGQLLLEPACGIGAVPHLLHVARLTNLGIQVIVLQVCKCTFTFTCTFTCTCTCTCTCTYEWSCRSCSEWEA